MKLIKSEDRPICRFKNISFPRGKHFCLRIDKLDFFKGRSYALIGPNGSGKTTLLQLLGLILKPAQGELELFGKSSRLKSSDLSRRIAIVEQSPYIFHGTVFDNISLGLRFRKVKLCDQVARVSSVLTAVGLPGYAGRFCRELSDGERKRVAFARALVVKPELLLLDEVTVNIDEESRLLILNQIKALILSGTTVVMSVHEVEQVEMVGSDVIRLESGLVESESFSGQKMDTKPRLFKID